MLRAGPRAARREGLKECCRYATVPDRFPSPFECALWTTQLDWFKEPWLPIAEAHLNATTQMFIIYARSRPVALVAVPSRRRG
jgi:hypothetical protein